MNYFLVIGVISQVAAAILSILFCKKYKFRFYKILCAFLVIVAITEVFGLLDIKFHFIKNNILHYNSLLIQFLLLNFIYKKLLKTKNWNKVINIINVLFALTWLWGWQNIKTSFSALVIFLCLNTSVLAFTYLSKLLVSEEIINYKKHLPFWVSVGFLVFYLPAIPFFTMQNYMNGRDLFFILHVLIILMNLLIITGIIWSKKEETLK